MLDLGISIAGFICSKEQDTEYPGLSISNKIMEINKVKGSWLYLALCVQREMDMIISHAGGYVLVSHTDSSGALWCLIGPALCMDGLCLDCNSRFFFFYFGYASFLLFLACSQTSD